MKAIKNILVPVDFSDNSKAAFEYAVGLAEDCGAKINVLNIYDDYTASAPLSDPLVMPSGKEVEDYEEDLKNFIESEKQAVGDVLVQSKVRVAYQVAYGTPIEELVRLSQTGDYDLIVMGTTGRKTFGEIMFGSTATNVSQKAYCPVLLVPAGVKYKGVADIVYACDFDHKSFKHAGVVADVARTFGASISLLFVKTEESTGKNYLSDVNDMREVFATQAPNVNFTAKVLEEDSVVEGVNHYCKETGADVVAVVTKHRSFWERMLHTSMTKEIAMYAEEPVLVIHVDD